MTHGRRRNFGRDKTIPAEPDVDTDLHGQAPGEQNGTDHEHDGRRDLSRDEDAETAARRAADGSPQARQGRALAQPRRTKRRERPRGQRSAE